MDVFGIGANTVKTLRYLSRAETENPTRLDTFKGNYTEAAIRKRTFTNQKLVDLCVFVYNISGNNT